MNYFEFLTRVIDDGVVLATLDKQDTRNQCKELAGGFIECKNKLPIELAETLQNANQELVEALSMPPDRYQQVKTKYEEVRWVCDVVSTILINEGYPPIVIPTPRAIVKAHEILGTK